MAWRAEIILSSSPETDFYNVQVFVDGDSHDDALNGAKLIFDRFGAGCERFIRVVPEASSERDFDTKELKHRGYTRFSFADKPGVDHVASNEIVPLPFSLASMAVKS